VLLVRIQNEMVTKEGLQRELRKQSTEVAKSIENTISEATDEVLYAIHDRFDDVEDRLDRIEDRLDRHLAV
jgi:Mg2+ and Co2+ transporter CorA